MSMQNKYKGNGRLKTKGELAAERNYSPRYLVEAQHSKTYYRKLGMLRSPRKRGMGITRKPGSRRLPARTIIQRLTNPQRRMGFL